MPESIENYGGKSLIGALEANSLETLVVPALGIIERIIGLIL